MNTKTDIPVTTDVPVTYEDKVNAAVSQVTRGEDNKLVYPEEYADDEAMKFALTAEIRRRDTQASFSKNQAELTRLKAQQTATEAEWEKDAIANLSKVQQNKLEELKATDPDAWRAKITELESEAKTTFTKRKQEVATKAHTETENQYRERVMEEFVAANPELEITDEVIADELPPKFLKQLEKGDVTFEEFLTNAKTYLTKGKVIKGDGQTTTKVPDLSLVGGSNTPDEAAIAADIKQSYANDVF